MLTAARPIKKYFVIKGIQILLIFSKESKTIPYQISQFHSGLLYFLKIHFNIIFVYMLSSSKQWLFNNMVHIYWYAKLQNLTAVFLVS